MAPSPGLLFTSTVQQTWGSSKQHVCMAMCSTLLVAEASTQSTALLDRKYTAVLVALTSAYFMNANVVVVQHV